MFKPRTWHGDIHQAPINFLHFFARFLGISAKASVGKQGDESKHSKLFHHISLTRLALGHFQNNHNPKNKNGR